MMLESTNIAGAVTRPPQVELNRGAVPADLNITIMASKDGQGFYCTVQTPLLDDYKKGSPMRWDLPPNTYDLVKSHMADFAAKRISNAQRIAELKSAGKKLFQISPPNFREVYWKMVEAGTPPKTVSIVTQEPYIPWELMVPRRRRDGGEWQPVKAQALGTLCAVGRWIRKDEDESVTSPPQKINLVDSYVIAPEYKDKLVLKCAEQEAQMVLGKFPGEVITPATFEGISGAFLTKGVTLVHFACHGADAVGKQAIYLEDSLPFTSDTVLGMDSVELAFQEKRPLVFLNACEAGRLAADLVGIGGFADSFIQLGASGVVAPLWSVRDTVAHQVATEFYEQVEQHPETPFAEILRRLRERSYDSANGEDTYAAYAFYGDPLASRASA